MIREGLIGSEQCSHQRLFYSLASVLGLQLPWVDILDKVMSAAGIAYYGSHLSPYGTKEIWHECRSMVLLRHNWDLHTYPGTKLESDAGRSQFEGNIINPVPIAALAVTQERLDPYSKFCSKFCVTKAIDSCQVENATFVKDAENRIRLDFGEALDSNMDDICSTRHGDPSKQVVESWRSEEQLESKVRAGAIRTKRSGEDPKSADGYENPLLSSDVTPKKRAEMAKKAEGAEGISVRLERRGNIHHTTAQDRKGKQDNRTPEQEARLKKRRTKAAEARAKRTPEEYKLDLEKARKRYSKLTPETKEQRKKLAQDRNRLEKVL
jgi:hypothetical protein